MKLFCLTVREDFQYAEVGHVIANNEKEAKENAIKTIMEAEGCTKEEVEDTCDIKNIHELTEIDGYKITLTKI